MRTSIRGIVNPREIVINGRVGNNFARLILDPDKKTGQIEVMPITEDPITVVSAVKSGRDTWKINGEIDFRLEG